MPQAPIGRITELDCTQSEIDRVPVVKHEVVVRVLEPVEYRVISEEAQAWSVFIKTPTGST